MSEVVKTVDGSKGRYVLDTPGGEAEMTFSVLSPHVIIVDHTGVPEAVKGQGFGRVLFDNLVADARENGIKIIPLCPFVNRLRAENPDTADVFQV